MSASRISLRRQLLAALIGTVLLVWLVVLVLVYRAAQHEVEEVFDADLSRSARTLQTLMLHEAEEEQEMSDNIRRVLEELGGEGLTRYPGLASILAEYDDGETKERLELVGTAQQAGHEYGSGLVFIARYRDGSVMLKDTAAPDIPLTEPGYADLQIGEKAWRIFRLTDPATGLTVQVGERHAFRSELVRYITRNTLMPLLVALPIMALLIWVIVGRILAPLQRVAREVSRRAPDSLEAIDAQRAPLEVDAVVQALNKLFGRLRAALERERQFTADAAHELRTPLAALKTHLQVAHGRAADSDMLTSIGQALDGVDRATHSVEQLLLLARADAGQPSGSERSQVDLSEVAREGGALMSQLAFERDIDLGVEADGPAVIYGDQTMLLVLLRNLIDNAVRYTQVGGTVTVSAGADDNGRWLCVMDDGPGIAADERAPVFNRFHRGASEQAAGTSGSGLGLSIVKRIARLHEAQIVLGQGIGGRGLGVTVRFPGFQPAVD
jgi:two-component system sensor histidine kinase QseC